jgi:hypothetical protein
MVPVRNYFTHLIIYVNTTESLGLVISTLLHIRWDPGSYVGSASFKTSQSAVSSPVVVL